MAGLNSIIDPQQSFATDDFNILRKIFNKQAFTGPAVILFILLYHNENKLNFNEMMMRFLSFFPLVIMLSLL
jgi:hypothetical protein